MKKPILVKRYAQGLAGALKDEAEFTASRRELAVFLELISAHGILKDTLASPFVGAREKAQVIRDILDRSGFSDKTTRFVLLLVEHGRLGLLGEVLEALPAIWQEGRGVITFEVSSAVALAPDQKRRLQAKLERLEGGPVFLRYAMDPGVLAGISLRKGNVIYDASLRGQLAKIKQVISEG
jgi:F-type H+-transporting ATPase subunit delta